MRNIIGFVRNVSRSAVLRARVLAHKHTHSHMAWRHDDKYVVHVCTKRSNCVLEEVHVTDNTTGILYVAQNFKTMAKVMRAQPGDNMFLIVTEGDWEIIRETR